jgi:tRNA threonylcarbamoyladenosine biosynthesis protein TsaB
MILGLDTTTENLHLALVAEPRAWTRRVTVDRGASASVTLLPAIEVLLAEAGATPSDLTGVCACVGPGGFTSLRLGVATAEGLAVTGLPTWGFSAFALRAETLRAAGLDGQVWILLDGQRGEGFHQLWRKGPLTEAGKAPFPHLATLIGRDPWWAPESQIPKIAPHLATPPLLLGVEGEATLAGLVRLCRRLPQGPPESPLHPFYLRETDAELNFPNLSAHLSDAHRKGIAR